MAIPCTSINCGGCFWGTGTISTGGVNAFAEYGIGGTGAPGSAFAEYDGSGIWSSDVFDFDCDGDTVDVYWKMTVAGTARKQVVVELVGPDGTLAAWTNSLAPWRPNCGSIFYLQSASTLCGFYDPPCTICVGPYATCVAINCKAFRVTATGFGGTCNPPLSIADCSLLNRTWHITANRLQSNGSCIGVQRFPGTVCGFSGNVSCSVQVLAGTGATRTVQVGFGHPATSGIIYRATDVAVDDCNHSYIATYSTSFVWNCGTRPSSVLIETVG
jgi:hypothetical protein